MKDLEIPHVEERGKRYRFFEMLPGILTLTVLTLPFWLSLINVTAAAFFVIGFLLLWFLKTTGLNIRSIQGYRAMKLFKRLPWKRYLEDLETGEISYSNSKDLPKWHPENVQRLKQTPPAHKPSQLVHAVMIATYNETKEVLEPTIQAVIDSELGSKQMIFILAYEGRTGKRTEDQAKYLTEKYKPEFMDAIAIKHTVQPGEVKGKGANITHAGRQLQKYLDKRGIDPKRVIVTTLDADNRVHPLYFSVLTYVYSVALDPIRTSYQPVNIYSNNIWDAPAPMRVLATGNSFWNTVMSMRPHILRNFSAHAQSMQALIDSDFWSVRTVVEDGHQFWRTYFCYDGQHEVFPLYIPVYQDAVLSTNYRKTFKTQFMQLRRWAWGASDVAYVAEKGFFTKNKVPRLDLTFKFLRLLEGHVGWATAPLLLAFSAFVPLLFNPDEYAANQLPIIASSINTLAMAGIAFTFYFSLKMLPKKPERYKRSRTVFMVLQWGFLPLTTIFFGAFSALNSQIRLVFGKYLGQFDVTDKAVVTKDRKRII